MKRIKLKINIPSDWARLSAAAYCDVNVPMPGRSVYSLGWSFRPTASTEWNQLTCRIWHPLFNETSKPVEIEVDWNKVAFIKWGQYMVSNKSDTNTIGTIYPTDFDAEDINLQFDDYLQAQKLKNSSHSAHEVVTNEVLGKKFRYCRTCKEEVDV